MSHEPGTEGYYVDENGVKRDDLLHGSCNPSDEEGFNRAMWAIGIKNGTDEGWLTHLYGPKPTGQTP